MSLAALSQHLSASRDAIIAQWQARVCREAETIPGAHALPEPELRDSLPDLLDEMGRTLSDAPAPLATTEGYEPGRPRWRAGGNLAAVLRELSIFREVLLTTLTEDVLQPGELTRAEEAEARLRLHRVIDCRMAAAVTQFQSDAHAERQRVMDRAACLTEADRRKDEFLAMLAHELRNPLGAISNALEVLSRAERSSPAFHRSMSVVERQVQQQVRIVDDLLDVSRITRGKIALDSEWVDLGRLIERTVDDYGRAVEAAGLTLALSVPAEAVWVTADPTRLAQVMGNLLTNATKFAHPGGQIAIALTCDTAEARAIVAVHDNGIGIGPEMLPHIFESFAQADHTLDRQRGGLGLGLALVKGLIGLHGGEVRAESAGLECGATFTFTLPLPPLPAPPAEAPRPAPAAVRRRRILVIEDNPDAAETLKDVLEISGHQVEVALSGPAGVQAVGQFQPEVVLCDIGLPGMDGYAVARTLRQQPSTTAPRLLSLSGYGQEEDRRQALAAGFEHHLTKPVNFTELLDLVEATTGASEG